MKNNKQQNETKIVDETILEEFEENESVEEDEVEVVDLGNEATDEVKGIESIINEKDNLAKDYLDKLQRTLAEYDNFRKRTLKEKSQMYENGAKEVFEKILPIVDNFERALGSISEEEKASSFAQGIDMIYKQLIGALNGLGVQEMDVLNKEFDPLLHHAVSHEENEEHGTNEVIDVFQKGYMFKDRVLRFSMVKVAN